MEEKPYSRRIQDSVHDINQKGVEIRLFSDGYQLAYVDKNGRQIHQYQHVSEDEVKRAIAKAKRDGEKVYYFVNADIRHKLGDDDWSSVEEENYKKANEAPLKKDYDRSKETDNKFLKSTKQVFSVSYMKDGVIYINKVRANSIEDAIRKVRDNGHKVVVFTNEALHELGKNNSIGKYDRVVQAMRSLYSETLLPDDKLKEKIRQTLPRLIAKYVKE